MLPASNKIIRDLIISNKLEKIASESSLDPQMLEEALLFKAASDSRAVETTLEAVDTYLELHGKQDLLEGLPEPLSYAIKLATAGSLLQNMNPFVKNAEAEDLISKLATVGMLHKAFNDYLATVKTSEEKQEYFELRQLNLEYGASLLKKCASIY